MQTDVHIPTYKALPESDGFTLPGVRAVVQLKMSTTRCLRKPEQSLALPQVQSVKLWSYLQK